MFRTIAEGWHWTPAQVEALTPQQVIHLSGGDGRPSAPGSPVSLAHPSEILDIARKWADWNSDDMLLRRAERLYARYLATGQ
jgi:hypothetical protein